MPSGLLCKSGVLWFSLPLGHQGRGVIWGYAHDIVTPDKNLPKLAGEIALDELLGITKLATKKNLS